MFQSDIENYDSKAQNGMMGLMVVVGDQMPNVKKIEKMSLYGTLVKVIPNQQFFYQQGNSSTYQLIKVLAFGRFKIISITKNNPNYIANVELITDEIAPSKE